MKSVQQRAKEAVAASSAAPSLVPGAFIAAPPPKEEEVIPDVRELVGDKKDLLLMRRLMTRHIELGGQESRIKKERDKITLQLKGLVGKYQIAKATYDGDRINYFTVERHTINGSRLLAAGIAPSVITAATDVTTSYTLKITKSKEEAEGEVSNVA